MMDDIRDLREPRLHEQRGILFAPLIMMNQQPVCLRGPTGVLVVCAPLRTKDGGMWRNSFRGKL